VPYASILMLEGNERLKRSSGVDKGSDERMCMQGAEKGREGPLEEGISSAKPFTAEEEV
jgi:hypothetical protein